MVAICGCIRTRLSPPRIFFCFFFCFCFCFCWVAHLQEPWDTTGCPAGCPHGSAARESPADRQRPCSTASARSVPVEGARALPAHCGSGMQARRARSRVPRGTCQSGCNEAQTKRFIRSSKQPLPTSTFQACQFVLTLKLLLLMAL